SGDLEFCELNRDGYDHVLCAGERFDIPAGRDRYRARLKARFPAEADGIDAVFDTLTTVNNELATLQELPTGLALAALPWRLRHLITQGMRGVSWLLDKHLHDPVLKTIIAAIAGDYAVGPRDAPVA